MSIERLVKNGICFGGPTWVGVKIIECYKSLSPSMTYAKQIFEVLCVLRDPCEHPDATDVHLETGLENDLLWSLTWARNKII